MNEFSYGIAIGGSLSSREPYLFGEDIKTGIKKARVCDYDAVEIHSISNPKSVNVNNLIRYCEKYNIKISAITTGLAYYKYKLNLTDNSISNRESAIKRLNEYVDLASKIDCPITIATMRGDIPNGNSLEVYKKRLAESLKRVAEYSAKKNVLLLLEVANRYAINYLNRSEEIREFILKYDIPMLKIHLDTFHMNIEEKNISKSIIDTSNFLGYFHVADNNRMYPGAGHIDFYSIAFALNYINYKGYIVVECLPIPDSESAAKNALKYIKSIFL